VSAGHEDDAARESRKQAEVFTIWVGHARIRGEAPAERRGCGIGTIFEMDAGLKSYQAGSRYPMHRIARSGLKPATSRFSVEFSSHEPPSLLEGAVSRTTRSRIGSGFRRRTTS